MARVSRVIGGDGDYSSIATQVVDDRGNLYVGGQFTLAGNKPSAYLAKWCAQLVSGGCTFSFEASVSTPEPVPVLSAPAPRPSKTPTTSATESGPLLTITPTIDPTGMVTEEGVDGRFWIEAGAVLTVLLGGLLLFRFRRS